MINSFNHILDDDEKNITAVKGLKLNNVQAIKAWGKGE